MLNIERPAYRRGNSEVSVSDTMTEDFATYIDAERARIESAKAELLQDRRLIDERLANLNDEMRAVEAYEAAKFGKRAKAATARAPRARYGSRRAEILNVIANAPAGIGRGGILEMLDIKGDKSGEMSVSNALTALKRSGQIVSEGGKYFVSAADEGLREAAE